MRNFFIFISIIFVSMISFKAEAFQENIPTQNSQIYAGCGGGVMSCRDLAIGVVKIGFEKEFLEQITFGRIVAFKCLDANQPCCPPRIRKYCGGLMLDGIQSTFDSLLVGSSSYGWHCPPGTEPGPLDVCRPTTPLSCPQGTQPNGKGYCIPSPCILGSLSFDCRKAFLPTNPQLVIAKRSSEELLINMQNVKVQLEALTQLRNEMRAGIKRLDGKIQNLQK